MSGNVEPERNTTNSPITATPAFDLYILLADRSAPASTDELVRAAEAAGGESNALETLRRLPSKEWQSIEEAVTAATSGWQPPAYGSN